MMNMRSEVSQFVCVFLHTIVNHVCVRTVRLLLV
jgi:hypothetical protein